MEKVDYLPLGSVVVVRGNVRKFMVIARGLMTRTVEGLRYFDYGGVLYPEGMLGDAIVYFNHADIQKVVAEGYRDDDDRQAVANIHDYLEHNPVVYGNPIDINRKNGRAQEGQA